MVDTSCTKDLLLNLCQKHKIREKLKNGEVKKHCFQLFGFLLNLVPRDPDLNGGLWKNQLLKGFRPIDALLAEIFSMRIERKYGRARKLEGACGEWINKLTESTPGHDFENCLKFLLCLSNWENADKIVLGAPWNIPVVSPTVFKEDETRTPATHGDSDLYKTSFCYTHYPDSIFEDVETFSSKSGDEMDKIFRATPGLDANGKTLFKQRDSRENLINYQGLFLFGAVRTPPSLLMGDSTTDVSLDLPILTEKPPNPMEFSLKRPASNLNVKKELTPEDEGFVDVESQISTPDQNDPTAIWEEVCRAKDILPPRSWETRLGPPQPTNKKTLLTQAGPEGTNNVYLNYLHDIQLMAGLASGSLLPTGPLLTLNQLFSDIVHLLLGVSSDTFPYQVESRKFYIQSSTHITGTTPETVGRLVEDFLDCGTIYVHLEEFSTGQDQDFVQNSDLGFVVQRFKEGVNDYLQYYRGFILHAAETHKQSLLSFHRKVLYIYKQLRYLKDLSAGERKVQARIGLRMGLPKGLQLLTFLYDQAIKDWGGDNTYLLLFLLRTTCMPYLVFLQNWLFEGVCYDPHSEYDIEMNENFLSEDFGEAYWKEGYKLKPKVRTVPFLGESMAKAILICGKSLNLLKLCHPKHQLFDARNQKRPSLSISLTQKNLLCTEEKSKAYFESMRAKLKRPKPTIVKKKKELKKCVDVTVPKPKEIVPVVFCSPKNVDKPSTDDSIGGNAGSKNQPEDEVVLDERDEEFRRLEAELREELMTEYEKLDEAENQKIKYLKWQTKRVELHTQRLELYKKEICNDSDLESVFSMASSSEMKTVYKEIVTLTSKSTTKTSSVKEQSFNLINFDTKLDLTIDGNESGTNQENLHVSTLIDCQKNEDELIESLKTDQLLSENRLEEMDNELDLDSDSESLPTVRERLPTASSTQLDNNATEDQDDLIEDDNNLEDRGNIFNVEIDTSIHEDKNDLNESEDENGPDEIQDVNVQDENQDMESSLYKSVYLVHDPAPYDDTFTNFASCPSRDIFSIAKSASQSFSPDSDTEEEDITSNIIPLPILLQRSLHPPLLAQIRLVNKATLNYFFDELQINSHFEALRNFFFFQDGEFGHSLSQLIFEKITDGSNNLFNSLSNPFELMGILDAALSTSLSSTKEGNLSDNLFLINTETTSKDLGFNPTKSIALKYNVHWPVSLIITDTCLENYNKIFSLLLQVKQIICSLSNCWYHLKNNDNRFGKLSGVLEFRRIQLFRHEMLHFIRSVHVHLCCQLLQLSWSEFQDNIKHKVKDLDELKQAHESYLNSALRRCLLATDQARILSLLEKAFVLIQQFHSQVLFLSWEQGRCCDTKGFERVTKTRHEFLICSLKLYKVLKRSLNVNYQPYVVDFLAVFDFNGFYDRTLNAHS